MSEFVQGSCEDFCPERESELRTKEHLLHFYEWKNGRKQQAGTLVSAFGRSAAGVKKPDSQDMRTESALKSTVDYLLKDIILDKRKRFNFVYDFVFDRLRAVRQEIVIQRYNSKQTIKLVQPVIMFLAYSRYSLCEESRDNFDLKICNQHMQECLKNVLCCYDEIDVSDLNMQELKNRIFIEALYQIFNLGATEALMRGLVLPPEIRSAALFKKVHSMSISYFQGNLYGVLSNIKQLPHILCATACLHLQKLRRKLFHIFSHAFNSKVGGVPTKFLCSIMCYSNEQELLADCIHYNLNIINSSDKTDYDIRFSKKDFNVGIAAPKSKKEFFVEEKFKSIYLPEILLLKKL